MALASFWRRAALAGAAVLALGACETDTATEESPPETPVVERPPRIAGELARGQQALAAGDLHAAQAAFTAALRGSPNDSEPAIGLAETYLALGNLDAAERLFDIVAKSEAGAQEPRLLQGRGLIALRQGRTDDAVQLLEQSVDRGPAQWRAWAALGRAYARQGKSRQSRKAFDRAEESAPAPAAVINDIGMSHLEQDNPAAALEEFQRALAIDPTNAHASGNARIARAMLRDYDAAVSGARQDELADVLNNVGYIAVINGDFDVADRLLRRAVDISPVFHEAARANLDLLAQAMKGVPVLEVAGAAIPATPDGATDIAATGLTGGGAADGGAAADPVSAAAPGDAGGGPTETQASEPENVAAPPSALAAVSASATALETEARVDGFRWEPPSAEVKEAIARARAARKAAARKAALERARLGDPGDPRTGAWPAIAPSDTPAQPETESAGSAHSERAGDRPASASPALSPVKEAPQADRPPPPPADDEAVEEPAATTGALQAPAGVVREARGQPAASPRDGGPTPSRAAGADASSGPAGPSTPAPKG